MCRVGLTVNAPTEVGEFISRLQTNGGSYAPESWTNGHVNLLLNRLDVTSKDQPQGTFPLEGKRYVICYNGEVFEFEGVQFNQAATFPTDVHLALDAIERVGLTAFFKDADIHGTFVLFDKDTAESIVLVDQLNTCGCFYASLGQVFIAASEYPVVRQALDRLGAHPSTLINIVKNGTMLAISRMGKVREILYRPEYHMVWSGREYSEQDLDNRIVAFDAAFTRAVEARIPKTGDVGVLVSGGVDSSLLLLKTVEALRLKGEEHRLRIFTFGDPEATVDPVFNDFLHVREVFSCFNLGADRLTIIRPEAIFEARQYLLENKIYTTTPRLVTPNPVRTHCRHTVTMSCVLAHVAAEFPEITAVLTGDGADELFAGYHSMCQDVQSGDELRERIHQKLEDFPLNDASRVALACYHGASCVNKQIYLRPAIERLCSSSAPITSVIDDLENHSPSELQALNDAGDANPSIRTAIQRAHPIEVRMPFTSHLVLRSLTGANVNYATGRIDGQWYSKLLLRLAAARVGVPRQIVLRLKVPFNEGGSGVKNSDSDPLELAAAHAFIDRNKLRQFVEVHRHDLERLGIIPLSEALTDESIDASFDKLALVAAATHGGLHHLLHGNVFRQDMPDSIYSTESIGNEYAFAVPLRISPCWGSS